MSIETWQGVHGSYYIPFLSKYYDLDKISHFQSKLARGNFAISSWSWGTVSQVPASENGTQFILKSLSTWLKSTDCRHLLASDRVPCNITRWKNCVVLNSPIRSSHCSAFYKPDADVDDFLLIVILLVPLYMILHANILRVDLSVKTNCLVFSSMWLCHCPI